jgi:outer membrane lipoprotein SlyB
METKTRLHPLLTAAAISVTVFSAVGVASLTGMVPHSIGSQKDLTPLQIPADVAKPVEPAITHPAPAPSAKPAIRKPAARAHTPQPTPPVAYGDFGSEPRLAQVEAPRPVVKAGNLATVQSVREVKDAGQHTGLGPIAGGIAGAVLGDQIGGKGNTRKVLTVLGAAGGAYAGREIEKQARATKHWEIDVRRDDGALETIRSDVAPPYNAGDRVRLVEGRIQPV